MDKKLKNKKSNVKNALAIAQKSNIERVENSSTKNNEKSNK